MLTIDGALKQARDRLQATSDSAALEARRLLEHVLGVNSAYLITHGTRTLAPGIASRFLGLAERRARGEPLAYIVGHVGFWTLDLVVDRRVLIPRPDTETLVEAALSRLGPDPLTIADLGTGSGAIALALARERPAWRIWATDASENALACARSNATRLTLDNVTFACGEWFDSVAGRRFDAIVSNPPYVAETDTHLNAPELGFEPRRALVAPEKGLADLARIVVEAPAYLRSGGWLMLEHGATQGLAVRRLMSGYFESIQILADLGGRPRVTVGQLASTISER